LREKIPSSFLSSRSETKSKRHGNEGVLTNAAVQKGIVTLIKDLLFVNWSVEGDTDGMETVHLSKILIDSGYVPEVVDNAVRLVNSPIVMPGKGSGVKAVNKPMRQWQKKGRRFGTYWIAERPQGRPFRIILVDTNH
jgi:hypothetical protein